jgi:hypothetical protein
MASKRVRIEWIRQCDRVLIRKGKVLPRGRVMLGTEWLDSIVGAG